MAEGDGNGEGGGDDPWSGGSQAYKTLCSLSPHIVSGASQDEGGT